MSRPWAFPVGPTRFADKRTSMPPPDPRSRTISPGRSSASAVGLPQPKDALNASSGIPWTSAGSYRFEVIGSTHPSELGADPQHELLPVLARSAASPYFCLTNSLNSIASSFHSKPVRFSAAQQHGCGCSTRRKEIRAVLLKQRYLPCNAENYFHAGP